MATTQQEEPSIEEFARKIQHQITQIPDCEPLTLSNDTFAALNRHIDQIPLPKATLQISTRRQLDSEGSTLWNTCLKLMAARLEASEMKVLSTMKVFAFAILECAAPTHGSGNYRALNLALNTARTCMDSGELDLSLKVLGTAAARLEALDKSGKDTEKTQVKKATTEYYMLRIYLSWLQGRPDIADHLFSKVPHASSEEERRPILEICYNVGQLALSEHQYDVAARWLERAMEYSDGLYSSTKIPDVDMKDSKLLVLHGLVRANLRVNTEDSGENTRKAMEALKTIYGNTFAILVIQLELLSRGKPNDHEYFEVVQLAVEAMESTDDSLKIILCYIKQLQEWNIELSVEALRSLIFKLAPSGKSACIEKAFVTLVWILTSADISDSSALDRTKDVAQRLDDCGNEPLSGEAISSILIFIWRIIDKLVSNNNIFVAEQWCHFVLEQPMFQNCSPDSKAKLQRKLVLCALEQSNVSMAQDTIALMTEESKRTPLTIYLMYKVAELTGDLESKNSCHESLRKIGAPGITYLLSCAAESRRLGKTRETINCLQSIIANLEDECPEDVNRSVLLQSTICLLWEELEKNTSNTIGHLQQICDVFEAAMRVTNIHNSTDKAVTFSGSELEWFFGQSYRIALHSFKSPHSQLVVRLLDVSTKFADIYIQENEPEEQLDLYQHSLACTFLKAVRITSEARNEKDPIEKKNQYHQIRTSNQTFRTHIQPQLQKNCHSPTERNEWLEKYRIILSFDFEAAISLQQYDHLPPLIEESSSIVDDKLCSIFLDLILSSHAPGVDVMNVVKTIICTCHASPSPYLSKPAFRAKLPRYLRCLYQLALNATDNALAESVLDQVLVLVRQDHCSYPNDEIEWLATMVFNRAVDFFLASGRDDFLRWAGKAIELADAVGDQCALGRLLRRNFAKLSEGV